MKPNYLIILALFIVVSCSKDKAANSPTIEIGNNSGLQVTQLNLDITSPSFGVWDEKEVDINNDGQMDLRFRSIYHGSSGLGLFYNYRIETIHNDCSIAGTIANDTMWLKNDTTYLVNPQGGMAIIWELKRACAQLDASYTQLDVDHDQLSTTLFQSGETLKVSDYFSKETTYLHSLSDHSTPLELEMTIVDTNYYSVASVIREVCEPATDNVSGYLGFKLNTSNGTKLGWVKLAITDAYSIQVSETAIQP